MLEAATQFQDDPVNFHLFVVTASPMQGTWGDTRQNRFGERGRDMLQDAFGARPRHHAN